MSAAALSAHRQPSEPYSTQSRQKRDQCYGILLFGSGLPRVDDTIRGRAKYQLPCEP